MKAPAIVAASILVCFVGPPRAGAQSSDPSRDKNSNVEMRACYSNEQARVNADTDSLASNITARFRKLAQDPALGPNAADLLRKAADAVTRSQQTWKAYRDQHCRAVAYSWTTGSGSGTAYESCMFRLGQARLAELHTAFNLPKSQ